MAYKYTQQRDMEWLKALPFATTNVMWKDHFGVSHLLILNIGENKIIYYGDTWVAYIDHTGTFHTKPKYFKLFPFNNSSINDFIDTCWYLLEGQKEFEDFHELSSLFYAPSGKLSQKALSTFFERLGDFNSVTCDILNKIFSEDFTRLGRVAAAILDNQDIRHRVLGRISMPSDLIIYGYIGEDQYEIEEEYLPEDEVMLNIGYRYREYYDEDNDEDRGYWALASSNTVQPIVTCKCGQKVPKNEIYGNKCVKCLTCPKEKIKINNYSEKAEAVFDFVEKEVRKPLESNKNRTKMSQYYKKYLENIGVSIKANECSVLYIGAELEYECENRENDKVEVLELLHEHAILKSDGSINSGFEIVTKPATYEEQEKYMKSFFENFPSGLRAASNCGLHFHVSRKPLSLMTQGKMIEFMNRDDNADFIELVAGRERNHYNRMDSARTVGWILQGGSGDRYNTLNSNSPNTLEFRIFSPAITWEDFASKMEFCLALCDYFKSGISNAPLKDCTNYGHFKDWIKNERKTYPNLHLTLFGENEKKKAYFTRTDVFNKELF